MKNQNNIVFYFDYYFDQSSFKTYKCKEETRIYISVYLYFCASICVDI